MNQKIKAVWKLVSDTKERKIKLLEIKGKHLDDETYLKKMFRIMTGRPLDLDNPKTYTEKLQWLKLYNRDPQYTMMQDKYAVRDYVKTVIGEEYLIPLLGVWNNADDIEFDKLPNEFVLKCNHDCASVMICRDKSRFDQLKARKRLNQCLKTNYYQFGREWAYKDINSLIIAEQYMHNNGEKTLNDYKFFCCSGKAKMVLIASGEAHTDQRRLDYFDLDFHHLPIRRGSLDESGKVYTKPDGFDQLIPLAEKLAGDIPFVRVDFYLIGGHPYFGEVAFYPSAGFAEFSPHEWEEKVGSWITLPIKKQHD